MKKICKKIGKKNFTKKKFKFFFQKMFREFLKKNFFGYRVSTANFGYVCKHLGCLGPLVLEEIYPAQTVVNPKIYILMCPDDTATADSWAGVGLPGQLTEIWICCGIGGTYRVGTGWSAVYAGK
jgi:hypothetical protein